MQFPEEPPDHPHGIVNLSIPPEFLEVGWTPTGSKHPADEDVIALLRQGPVNPLLRASIRRIIGCMTSGLFLPDRARNSQEL